ncbi:heme-binding protein [Nocardia heshunensis]
MSELFRAAAPTAISIADLGPLRDLPGTWMGSGFSLVELPARNGDPFRLKLTATRETVTFTAIGSPIPNRGSAQDDIVFRGVHYLQHISDAETNEAVHVETGMWLFVPATTAPAAGPTIVRMATIPHGDAFMAQGAVVPDITGAPTIPALDSTPSGFTFGGGYFPPKGAQLPVGIPDGALQDPTVLLTAALKEQTVVNTTTLDVRTGAGDIRNIGFVSANADAIILHSTFWLETLQGPDQSELLQLQYSQQSMLRFPAGPNPDPSKPIDWPHLQVATLLKQ